MIPLDQWSRQVDRALGFLFSKEPERASLGVVVGCALSSLSVLFEPALRTAAVVDVSAMSWWSWLPLGVAIMYAPKILWLLKRPSVGPHDAVLESIERANFSAAERRQQYRKVIDHHLQLVAADYTLQQQKDVQIKRAAG